MFDTQEPALSLSQADVHALLNELPSSDGFTNSPSWIKLHHALKSAQTPSHVVVPPIPSPSHLVSSAIRPFSSAFEYPEPSVATASPDSAAPVRDAGPEIVRRSHKVPSLSTSSPIQPNATVVPPIPTSQHQLRSSLSDKKTTSKSSSATSLDARKGTSRLQTLPDSSVMDENLHWAAENIGILSGVKRKRSEEAHREEEEEEEEEPNTAHSRSRPKKTEKPRPKRARKAAQSIGTLRKESLTPAGRNFLLQVALAADGPGSIQLQQLTDELSNNGAGFTIELTNSLGYKALGSAIHSLTTKIHTDQLKLSFAQIRLAVQISEYVPLVSV